MLANRAAFQRTSKEQGDLFEETAEMALKLVGFSIVGRHVFFPNAGVNIDFIADNKNGISFYVTCKGSIQGDRPGCERTDTLKKAIAEAYLLSRYEWWPILLLTSHLPTGRSGLAMLKTVERSVLFDAIVPTSKEGQRRLRQLVEMTGEELERDCKE
jgi:hypothetical protein